MLSDHPAAPTCQSEGSLCIPRSCAPESAAQRIPLFRGPCILNWKGTERPFYCVKRPALQQKRNLIWPLKYSCWAEQKGEHGLISHERRCRKLCILHLLTFKHFFWIQSASSLNILHAKMKKKKKPKTPKKVLPFFVTLTVQAGCSLGAVTPHVRWSRLLSRDHRLFDVAFTEEDHALSTISLCSWGTDSPAGTPVSRRVSRLGQN